MLPTLFTCTEVVMEALVFATTYLSIHVVIQCSSATFCSYNKTEEDFSSLREYNDYLEEVETIGKSECPHISLLFIFASVLPDVSFQLGQWN